VLPIILNTVYFKKPRKSSSWLVYYYPIYSLKFCPPTTTLSFFWSLFFLFKNQKNFLKEKVPKRKYMMIIYYVYLFIYILIYTYIIYINKVPFLFFSCVLVVQNCLKRYLQDTFKVPLYIPLYIPIYIALYIPLQDLFFL
jgi:hypothetical protein